MSDIYSKWENGCGVIAHSSSTKERVQKLVRHLSNAGVCEMEEAYELFKAADILTNMSMWLTVHMTYAQNVYLDGRELQSNDFKIKPEGHTGGALNMVPAYIGYLLANALTSKTRGWLMGQGHCVAGIDAVNIMVDNLELEQKNRYHFSDEGLSRLCKDFYSYEVGANGKPVAPLGSHVGPFTAGGISEGGYLGFAELQYMHMPLPGQELVTFLSDGAFEEQRGSDWASRWWRGEDTGNVMPIMIANGRRIDQRTTIAQTGGISWFLNHLKLNGFDPIELDGRDPASIAWGIISMTFDLDQKFEKIEKGFEDYPIRLPYAVAETVKGFGFPGAGSNAAHNLPLEGSPATLSTSAIKFNEGAKKLFIPTEILIDAKIKLMNHNKCGRQQEKLHCLNIFDAITPKQPNPVDCEIGSKVSPMENVDIWFRDFFKANPNYRFRVGNPDEMRSNRMNKSLDEMTHRVTSPEEGISESIAGSVITALNEEAVISACLGNKQGINLAISYEAFAVKMLGAMRQEIIFARHKIEVGRAVNWLSVPVIVSSHTWENGKNEHSHQDPTLCEAWLQEMSDMAPVLFPFDANCAVACLSKLYGEKGKIATVVIPKNSLPVVCSKAEALEAAKKGYFEVNCDANPLVQLIAIGAYQLQAVMRAAEVLRSHQIACSVIAIVEPGRFRTGRDEHESKYVYSDNELNHEIPLINYRVIVTHTHSDIITGVLRRLDTGGSTTTFMGYRNRGGTLDVFGMQYANKQTWAHIVLESLNIIKSVSIDNVFTQEMIDSLNEKGNPHVLN